tara:strand:+ start:1539 stop:2513 length:975 start_codon:yes stop_codon:yes gene_type:complete
MIISRSPLRISLAGGGTDIPSYYKIKESYFISAAINKYVYVSITEPFEKGIYLKYSKSERVQNVNLIKHQIIKEVLKKEKKINKIEITTLTDIPAKTGLGSSGSFTTCLIKSIYGYKKKFIDKIDLAELACDIEINKLKQPSGKQDQYISVYGGVSEFRINKRGIVTPKSLNLNDEIIEKLEDNLLLYFTGFSRNSSKILNEQNKRTILNDKKMIQNLDFIKSLAFEIKKNLIKGDLKNFGYLMNEHWNYKISRSKNMSNRVINDYYEFAMKNGAIGGKVVGAGGGGFLLFYSESPAKLRKAMKNTNLKEVRFKFDFEGVKQIL